jgi:dihydrofolate reductase
MKEIKVFIAVSLDGFIAYPDGGMDWLTEFPNPEKTDYGYKDLLALVDTVIMGGKTYRELLNMDVIWPYKEQTTYVVTHGWTENAAAENIQFITDNIIETISELRKQGGKDIWLVGGGELTAMLLAADLVNEMQICYIPVILGKGIPLFPNQPKQSKWELMNHTAYQSGVLKVDYSLKKK